MFLYLINEKTDAIQIRELLKLKAGCLSLYWNTTLEQRPDKVKSALKAIENYISDQVSRHCNEATFFAETNDEQDEVMFASFKESEMLKRTLGSEVVLESEAESVMAELSQYPTLQPILDALSTGKNLILL